MTICKLTTLFATLAMTVFATQAIALPTQMFHIDTPDCDQLFIPVDVDEIGDVNVFPSDEALFASDQGLSQFVPCPANNDTGKADFLVDIRNLSGRAWSEVWYVANPETTITNYDGEANQAGFSGLYEAFRIDRGISDPLGTHHPLVFENMNPDGIWEIGESWQFVLQDYSNTLGLPASAINSQGVGSASATNAAGLATSSGSIIGVALIPEPASVVLLLLFGCAGLGITRRR